MRRSVARALNTCVLMEDRLRRPVLMQKVPTVQPSGLHLLQWQATHPSPLEREWAQTSSGQLQTQLAAQRHTGMYRQMYGV